MYQRCDICDDVFVGTPNITYRGRCLCPTCFEVRHLVDGLMIDMKIEKVELLVLSDGVESFNRGFDAIN